MLRPRPPTTPLAFGAARQGPEAQPRQDARPRVRLIVMSERPDLGRIADAKGRDDPHPGDPNDDETGRGRRRGGGRRRRDANRRGRQSRTMPGAAVRGEDDAGDGRARLTEPPSTPEPSPRSPRRGSTKAHDVSFAVSYHNRFKTQGDPVGAGKDAGDKAGDGARLAAERHGRREVIEAVAGGARAAPTAAGATWGLSVDLRDPDVVAFAEGDGRRPRRRSRGRGGQRGRGSPGGWRWVWCPSRPDAFERRKKGIMPPRSRGVNRT